VIYDGSSTYYYGLERIAQERNSTTEYFLPDALGSVRQIANAGGAVTLGQSFDPFGNPDYRSGIGSSSYGFAGEWTDGTGLQSLRARYYSPAQGRRLFFLTREPCPRLYFLNRPA
jgi:RHS repeat-associated protein